MSEISATQWQELNPILDELLEVEACSASAASGADPARE